MKIIDIIQQPEGRRLEFKEKLPGAVDLARTIVAFANDAGGEIIVGVKDKPREVVGLPSDDLPALEEKISNIIHDHCSPLIRPDISIVQSEDKYLIRITIHKGSDTPYHLKNKAVEKSTFVRVGSTIRLASLEIIAELSRHRQNTSFDSELVYSKALEEINIATFANQYAEVTGEALTEKVLSKLELIRIDNGRIMATNALVLLSDDELRRQIFPYAIVECARFKGITPGNFIDQKTIDDNIGLQAEQAYQFVLRHISQNTTDYVGVYRTDRWEYPIVAIREAIRNAIIHRDYSLTGKDIKIAIFDDKIEITSPGCLLPSVDYDDMESGQSDIRNKILAPVFRKLGIIEKWGNGLRLIAEELQKYPRIGFSWKEPGLSFRVVFFKKDFHQELEEVSTAQETTQKTTQETTQETTQKTTQKTPKKTTQKTPKKTTQKTITKTTDRIIQLLKTDPTLNRERIAEKLGDLTADGVKYHLNKLRKEGKIKRIGPDKGGSWEIQKE